MQDLDMCFRNSTWPEKRKGLDANHDGYPPRLKVPRDIFKEFVKRDGVLLATL
ncbi:predicted protein [Pyrenophora tritici-repentis Pt-1C-BFP]|uniref:Uncharacterized protein n=1 Tax=Pyrenophora tritici-repentis (strain Pt-1C-BFP) TaxID=426418 RepID=B2W6H8_PYRTR|nr:uncharacterized protein PTRG_05416 [Pyrenophora tritici-repentis Pt-1C-BFP]EDU48336.1 predicted protein [Pyrenophora tritici-repentis Pt-1C-BFP]